MHADALSALPGIEVLRSADLTPDRLLSALAALHTAPTRPAQTDGFDGATRTVTLTETMRKGTQ